MDNLISRLFGHKFENNFKDSFKQHLEEAYLRDTFTVITVYHLDQKLLHIESHYTETKKGVVQSGYDLIDISSLEHDDCALVNFMTMYFMILKSYRTRTSLEITLSILNITKMIQSLCGQGPFISILYIDEQNQLHYDQAPSQRTNSVIDRVSLQFSNITGYSLS